MDLGRDRGKMVGEVEWILERLCAPELTLAEAADLRGRLAELLAAVDSTRLGPEPEPRPMNETTHVACCAA